MAGAGYKLFNTGDVLTAAQVNTYLMEQTVMVFANASARTTALSGVLAEGMLSYLKDTNKVYVYDGSAWLDVSSEIPSQTGNSGKYLTTDGTNASWGTISAGGMTLISTTTISNAAVLLSSIPQTYNNLVIVVRDFLPQTDGQPLRLRFNDDATANRHSEAGYGSGFTFDDTYFRFNGEATDDTTANNLTVATIWDYTNTDTNKFTDLTGIGLNSDGTSWASWGRKGIYNQQVAITSLRFLCASGVPKSGTILLYGVK